MYHLGFRPWLELKTSLALFSHPNLPFTDIGLATLLHFNELLFDQCEPSDAGPNLLLWAMTICSRLLRHGGCRTSTSLTIPRINPGHPSHNMNLHAADRIPLIHQGTVRFWTQDTAWFSALARWEWYSKSYVCELICNFVGAYVLIDTPCCHIF